MDVSDAEVIEATREDRRFFGELFERHFDAVFASRRGAWDGASPRISPVRPSGGRSSSETDTSSTQNSRARRRRGSRQRGALGASGGG
jgi:hypothetical protein